MDDTLSLLAVGLLIFSMLMIFFGAGYWIGQRQGWRDITGGRLPCATAEAKSFDALGQYPSIEDEGYLPF